MQKTHSQKTAANVRAEMARKRVSQRDMARHLGCSHTTMQRRLSGEVALDIDELGAIAAALDIPLSALLPSDKASA